jgi:hypothetical protein
MPRVATKLTPTKSGGFVARKRIPADAQEEYARLYLVRWEARFNMPPGTPIMVARAKHREWLTEIESRIANAASFDHLVGAREERVGTARLGEPLAKASKPARGSQGQSGSTSQTGHWWSIARCHGCSVIQP